MRIATHIALVCAAALCVMPAHAQQQGPIPRGLPDLRYDVPPRPSPEHQTDYSFKPLFTLPNGVEGQFGGHPQLHDYDYGSNAIGIAYPPFRTRGMQTTVWVCNRRGAPLAFRWEGPGLATGPGARLERDLCTASVRPSSAADFTVVRTAVPAAIDPAGILLARYRIESPDAPRLFAGTAAWRSFVVGGARAPTESGTHRLGLWVELAISESADRLTVTVDRVPSEYPLALGGLDRLIGQSALLAAYNPGLPVSLLPVRDVMDAESFAWLAPSWRDGNLLYLDAVPDQRRAEITIPLAPERARSLMLGKGLLFVMDTTRAIHAVAPYTLVAP